MLPHDWRAPRHQQRGIEVRNSSATEVIPPYAMLEVVGANFLDILQGGYYRLVFDVQKPSQNSLPAFLVNGPVQIGTADDQNFGWATADFPTLIEPEATPSSGDVGESYGTKADSFKAEKGQTGLVLFADLLCELGTYPFMRTGGGGTDEERHAIVTQDITAGTDTAPGAGIVQPLRLNAAGQWINDGGTISLINHWSALIPVGTRVSFGNHRRDDRASPVPYALEEADCEPTIISQVSVGGDYTVGADDNGVLIL